MTTAAPSRTAISPAAYAQSSPCRNDVFAAAVIWVAYCGYCSAIDSAPANDFVSWFWTLVLTWWFELASAAFAALA